MTLRERKSFFSTGTLVVIGIAAVAVLAAWQVGRRSERRAAEARTERARQEAQATANTAAREPVRTAEPPAEDEPAVPMESSATYEVPIAAHPPTEAAPRPQEERAADTPARCLMLQVSPTMASAYGRSGEVIQLVVRAQNGCGTNFGYASFRAIAIGADGREAGSAIGSFPGGIRAGGSAETLVAIPTKPSTALTYRAEVR